MNADRRQFLALLGVALVVIGAGIGLRDPWPPDEPRFVLIGRDMLATGQWLIPRIAGQLYSQKPPLYFWTMAGSLGAVPWPRIAFVLPSLLAAMLMLVLVYDLGRRLWGHKAGLAAAGVLLATFQFVVEARSAQIDMSVSFWITLGLYALLRHLLLGPAWGWYYFSWAVAGAGILTKGVGFLHLLLLLPWALARRRGWPGTSMDGSVRQWLTGPAVMLAVLAAWGIPMLLAADSDPALAAYRDQLLYGQTFGRYVNPEGHRAPPWFFLINVIPTMWLPAILLIPWLAPGWRDAWRSRATPEILLLGWIVCVLIFFSASPGKRGVYILPALPAYVLAAAPHLGDILSRRSVRILAMLGALALTLAAGVAAARLWLRGVPAGFEAGANLAQPIAAACAGLAATGLVAVAVCRERHALTGIGAILVSAWLVYGWGVTPVLDAARSGRPIVERAESLLSQSDELAMIDWKEQFMLHANRPVTHFGWRYPDRAAEARAAAGWLAADPARRLLLPDTSARDCFEPKRLQSLGNAHGRDWFLAASDAVQPSCRNVESPRLNPIIYTPPTMWRRR